MVKEQIRSILTESTDKIISELQKYLSSFKRSDILKITSSKEDIANIYKRYRALTSTLLSCFEKTDTVAAEIASLVCKSDRLMNIYDVKFFSQILDAYSQYKLTFIRFIDDNDNLFENNELDFKYSSVINCATTFLNNTIAFKKYL